MFKERLVTSFDSIFISLEERSIFSTVVRRIKFMLYNRKLNLNKTCITPLVLCPVLDGLLCRINKKNLFGADDLVMLIAEKYPATTGEFIQRVLKH